MTKEIALKIVIVSAFRIGFGRSFHQPGTMNENVLESDFVPLCDGAGTAILQLNIQQRLI